MPTSLVLAGVFAAGLGKGPGIAWSKDYTRAFAEAEERRAPLLVHFRGANCGRTTVPGATESRGGSRGDGITRPLHDTELGDCDLMQQDVLENVMVVELTRRYVPVLVGPGDETLNTRYQVIVNPTTLFLDPWGNEIFRVSGYLERAKFSRILQAVPTDFAPLAAAGRGLREKPDDLAALAAVAAFYESQRLRQVSERLYERAQAAPAAAGDRAGPHPPHDGQGQGGRIRVREGAGRRPGRSGLGCSSPGRRQRAPGGGPPSRGGDRVSAPAAGVSRLALHGASQAEPRSGEE